ncbi:MAG: hypothetical protein ACT4PU_12975 [Planctomycetota bacterium]
MSRPPVSRRATVLLLLPAAGVAGWALVELLRQRVGLAALWPRSFPILLAGQLAGAGALAVALLRRDSRLAPRVGFVALVLTSAAYLVWYQPYRALVALQAFGVAAGVLGLLATIGPPLLRRMPRRAVSVADLLLFLLCVCAVTAEAGLRVAAAWSASPLFASQSEELTDFLERQRLKRELPHAGGRVNSLRHFDEEFQAKQPGVPLAASIGDSFSTGIVPLPYHFTSVAERVLGRGAIHNFGVPGLGLEGYLYLLREEALPLRPDVVLVNVFIGNDLAEGLRHGREPSGAGRWLDRNQLLLLSVPRRLLRLSREPALAGLSAELAPESAPEPVQEPALPTNALSTPADFERLQPWLADPARELPAFTEQRFVSVERERARAACDPADPPDWRRIEELLLELRASCGETPFAVMLIPDEFQVEESVWELVRSGPGGEALERDLPQRRLTAWLAEQGIPCLDLLPILRAVPPRPDGLRLYHLRDTHFNARGNAAAGEALAEFLRRWWD